MLRWTGGSKTRADVANVQGGGGWGGGPLSCLSDKKRSPIGHDFSSSGIKEGRHARVRSSLDALINHTATGFAPHSRQRHHCRSVDVLGLTMAMENNNYNNKDTILRVARRPNDEANQAQKPQGGASSLVAPASHPITAKKLRHYETTTTTTTDNNSLFSSSFKAPGSSSSSSCSSPPTSVGAVASSGRSMAWGVTTGNYEGSPPSSGLPVEHRGGGGYEEYGTHRCFFNSMGGGGGRDNNAVTDYRPFMFRQGDTTMDAVVVDVHEEDDTNTDDGVIEMPLHPTPPQRRRHSSAASSFPFYFSIDAAADASCYSTRSGGSRPVFWVPSPHASHVLTQQQQQSSLPTSWHEEEEGGDCLFSDIDQNYRHDRQQRSGFAYSPPPPPPLFALPHHHHHHHFSFSSPSFVIL